MFSGGIADEAAAALLRGANRVYVSGFGGMSAVANYFYFIAHMVLPHFVLVGASGGTSIDDLAHIGEDDVLATFSVAPYSRETSRAVAFAKRRGAKVFAITDSRASPAGSEADVALFASTASVLPSNEFAYRSAKASKKTMAPWDHGALGRVDDLVIGVGVVVVAGGGVHDLAGEEILDGVGVLGEGLAEGLGIELERRAAPDADADLGEA